MRVPAGFEVLEGRPGLLIAESGRLEALRRAGLEGWRGWESRLDRRSARVARGAIGRLVTPAGETLLLKRLRRGGIAGPLHRDRFLGTRRLMANLDLPLQAIRRGVPTPEPVALFLLAGPPGLHRGWLAQVEIPDATDLATLVVSDSPPSIELLAEILRTVRDMHDRGVEHTDLNLGNLLVEGSSRIWVVDLDKARLHPGPLDFRLRQRALRRLERSWVKTLGRAGRAPREGHDRWYELYASEDAELARRLARGRAAGRFWLRLHELGWRR